MEVCRISGKDLAQQLIEAKIQCDKWEQERKEEQKKKQEIEFFLQSIDKFATIQKSLWPNFNVKDFTDTLNKDIQQYFSDFKLGKKSAVDIVNIIGSKLNYCTKPFYL